ncbi:hypothetical protein [Ferruginibacter sp.]
MKSLVCLMIVSMICKPGKSQDADHKIIYLKMIEIITKEQRIKKPDTILIADTIADWNQKENYTLISYLGKRQDKKTNDWDTVLKNYNFTPQKEAVKNYFKLEDIPAIDKVRFKYTSWLPANANIYYYWRLYFSPLYFNADNTKCIAVAEFLIGWCGTGSKRIMTFQKDASGTWIRVKQFK